MKTDKETLRQWIYDANTLQQYLYLFPEELRAVVARMVAAVNILAYENIVLEDIGSQ